MKKFLKILAGAIASVVLFSASAEAVAFNFIQGGWTAGGQARSFRGKNFNQDELIFTDEVSESLLWSGNSEVFPISFNFF